MKFTYDKNAKFSLSRDNLRQLDPKVFESAALLIDTEQSNFTCYAIEKAGGNTAAYLDAWCAAFENDGSSLKHPFWNYGLYASSFDRRGKTSAKQARMTSLAMMATLVRDARASRGAKRKKASQ